MATRKLDKAEWREFLDRATKSLVGKQAEIEVASLALGSQIEAEWLPVLGIAYDPKDDLVEVALENVDHMIAKPKELCADIGPAGLVALEVVGADGARQIVRFREPVELPAPAGARAPAADERS